MTSTSLGARVEIPWFRLAGPFASALIVLVFGAMAYEGVRRAGQATRMVALALGEIACALRPVVLMRERERNGRRETRRHSAPISQYS